MQNPMFVSLLYVTYKNKRELPLTQASFYRTVYDALYSDHDLTKDDEFKRERGSSLSRDELEFFFQKFAYYCFTKDINSFEPDPLLNIIREVLKDNYFIDKNQAYSIFLDITRHVPLITKDGVDYKWIHKSFLEYFTAKYISTHARKTKFLQSLKGKKLSDYENLIKIYVDIDRSTFDSVFVGPLLNSFIEHVEKEPIREHVLELRELVFQSQYIFTKVKKDYIEELAVLNNERNDLQNKQTSKSKYRQQEINVSGSIFSYLNEKIYDKFNIQISSMRQVPVIPANRVYSDNELLFVERNIIASGVYSNNENNFILLRILEEKKYPFIKVGLSTEERKVTSKQIDKAEFFNILNAEESSFLLINRDTKFEDLNLSLRDIYLAINSKIGSGVNLSYESAQEYLAQMKKQDDDFQDLWD
ncbi:hypothetical protein V8V80_11535 [Niallia taxi]